MAPQATAWFAYAQSQPWFLGSVDDPLHRLPVLSCGANVPHTQTVCMFPFHRGVIGGKQQLLVQVVFPED